jgi:hypothetical protein
MMTPDNFAINNALGTQARRVAIRNLVSGRLTLKRHAHWPTILIWPIRRRGRIGVTVSRYAYDNGSTNDEDFAQQRGLEQRPGAPGQWSMPTTHSSMLSEPWHFAFVQ